MNVTAEFINSMKNSSTCRSVRVHCGACAWTVLALLAAIDIDHSLTLPNASPHTYGNVSLKWNSLVWTLPNTPVGTYVLGAT